jgi:hypothetical protein
MAGEGELGVCDWEAFLIEELYDHDPWSKLRMLSDFDPVALLKEQVYIFFEQLCR